MSVAGAVLSGSAALASTPVAARGLAPTHYTLDFRLDFEETKLFGKCGVTLHNTGPAPVTRVPLYLYRLLSVSAATDGWGKPLRFNQRLGALPDWPERQMNLIDIELAQPLDEDQKTTLHITYDGRLAGYAELGMKYIQDRIDRQFTILREDSDAYPQIRPDSWADKKGIVSSTSFTYALSVTVPNGLVVANGGELVSTREDGDEARYTYRSIQPSWRIDVTVADYTIVRDDPFKVFCFKKDDAGGRRVMKALQDTLALYSKWFGPLRGSRGFTVIEIPNGWGSQTDVTSITQTAAPFQSDEGVPELYHEVAHLWNVASRDAAPCRVESEGFATFMQYAAQEHLQDKKGAVQANADRFIEQLRGTYKRDPRLAAVPMIRYGEEKLTDHSYTKGMVFFALLHGLIGEDALHRIVGTHYEKHAESGATSDEFFKTCRSIGMEKVDRLIDEWIYGERASEHILTGMTFQQLLDLYRGS